jgi:hypothetical protein
VYVAPKTLFTTTFWASCLCFKEFHYSRLNKNVVL